MNTRSKTKKRLAEQSNDQQKKRRIKQTDQTINHDFNADSSFELNTQTQSTTSDTTAESDDSADLAMDGSSYVKNRPNRIKSLHQVMALTTTATILTSPQRYIFLCFFMTESFKDRNYFDKFIDIYNSCIQNPFFTSPTEIKLKLIDYGITDRVIKNDRELNIALCQISDRFLKMPLNLANNMTPYGTNFNLFSYPNGSTNTATQGNFNYLSTANNTSPVTNNFIFQQPYYQQPAIMFSQPSSVNTTSNTNFTAENSSNLINCTGASAYRPTT